MSDFIELVIGLLEDLLTDSPLTQFLTLFGTASFMLALARSPYWLMQRK